MPRHVCNASCSSPCSIAGRAFEESFYYAGAQSYVASAKKSLSEGDREKAREHAVKAKGYAEKGLKARSKS